MPTYRVGSEPLQLRKSFREVLCEQCGKSMGMLYVARMPKQLEGLTSTEVLNFYPFMKVDIEVHEKQCPGQKKEEERPAG